jgi:hypothetical protein
MRVEPPTRTISSILVLSILASRKTFSTSSNIEENKLLLSSSKQSRVIVEKKSMPSCNESISIDA